MYGVIIDHVCKCTCHGITVVGCGYEGEVLSSVIQEDLLPHYPYLLYGLKAIADESRTDDDYILFALRG